MVGRTGSIRPEVPRASCSPPRHVLQFFVFAGRQIFSARRIETRAAGRLLNGKEVRVLSNALDENLGVGMSKAKASCDPSWVRCCELLVSNHCTPPSDRFVSGIVIPGAKGSHGSLLWKRKPGQATGSYALGRICSVAWCGVTKEYESLRSANGGHRTKLGVGQIDMRLTYRFLNRADAGIAAGDGGMQSEIRPSVTPHAVPANPISIRPEGRERGQKTCR